jgi:nucleoside-diphosphate-sugar epimerase
MASNIFSYRKRYNSKFIFISSSTVYGDRGSKKICGVEDTMIYGTTDYANSKIDGEFLAKSFKDTLIFRPCAMIDPKSKRGLCYDIVYKLKEGSNQITLMGDEPGSIKPYISAQFAASYIASKINSTGIYNVAPQDNVSVKTVAEIAMKISGKNKSVVWSGAAANFAGDNPVVAMSSDINVSSVDFLKNYFIEMFK